MRKELANVNKNNEAISCKDCCRQMGDYIDGKLSIDDDILFVKHIRGCRDCRDEFHNYYNFMTNLYFLNYGYNDRFPASEEELLKETEESIYKYRKSRRHFGLALIILALAVFVLVAFILIRHFGGVAL